MATGLDVDALWRQTRPDPQGLVPCVTQDLRSRAVLMVAWVSKEALAQALHTGWATYFSRSRGEVWEKGSTSGRRQRLVHVRLDCDGDTLLYLVEGKPPACHEGTDTCFSWRRSGRGWLRDPVDVATLDEEPEGPAQQPRPTSAREARLAAALAEGDDEAVLEAAADLLQGLAGGLRRRGLSFRQVLDRLDERLSGKAGADDRKEPGPITG